MTGKRKNRKDPFAENRTSRAISSGLFLIRKTKNRFYRETAYENQYHTASLQSPWFNSLTFGITQYSGAGIHQNEKMRGDMVGTWTVNLITRGKLIFTLNGNDYPVREGDVILDPPPYESCLRSMKGNTAERSYFVFSGGIVEERILAPEYMGKSPVVLSAPESQGIAEAFGKLLELGRTCPPAMTYEASKIIYGIFMDIACRKTHPVTDVRYRLYRLLERFTFRKYTLKGLADAMGMTTRTFSRYFIRQFGMTPAEYIRRQRIAFAAHTLETTNATISEIAELYTYKDAGYFSRDFRKCLHISPTDYRKKQQDIRRNKNKDDTVLQKKL